MIIVTTAELIEIVATFAGFVAIMFNGLRAVQVTAEFNLLQVFAAILILELIVYLVNMIRGTEPVEDDDDEDDNQMIFDPPV